MCDTAVVTHGSGGAVLFAKNSDREPEEPQALEIHPASDHPTGATLRCTHVSVPQAAHTHAVLLSRPCWMWGAEMGLNEHGVAIGNEAVFTHLPVADTGLTGMDLVRLALERAASAAEAVDVLTGLLEAHGQGGRAGFRNEGFRYHNSFIVADRTQAWVVETADYAWVAKVVRGVRAISNALTIHTDYDRHGGALGSLAREHGLHRGRGTVDFATSFARTLMDVGAAAHERRNGMQRALTRSSTALDAMAALRQHGAAGPARGLRQSVCAHGSWLPTRRSGQTTGSLIVRWDDDGVTAYATATSATCTSVFKPVWIEAGLVGYGPPPGPGYDARSLWWRHERLHRRALADLDGFLASFAPERDALERELVQRAASATTRQERCDVTARAFADAAELESRWLARLEAKAPSLWWRLLNAQSGMPA